MSKRCAEREPSFWDSARRCGTTPGAKICGARRGGSNHRIGLFDSILIKKTTSLRPVSLAAAVSAARARHPQLMLEVEVENFAELHAALDVASIASCWMIFARRCAPRGD